MKKDNSGVESDVRSSEEKAGTTVELETVEPAVLDVGKPIQIDSPAPSEHKEDGNVENDNVGNTSEVLEETSATENTVVAQEPQTEEPPKVRNYFSDDERNHPTDRFFIDELSYNLAEELRCAIAVQIPVTKGTEKFNVPLIIAKPENSRMFHILSAKDSSYRVGYAFLGHPCRNPRENVFHDVNWAKLRATVKFIVTPRTPKNSIIQNSLGVSHSALAVYCSQALESWFRNEYEKYIELVKIRSLNALQQMIFENLEVDLIECGIRWIKSKGSKNLYAYRKSEFGKKNITEIDPIRDSFGYAFIGQDKGGIRGQWRPKQNSQTGQNCRAPTRHGGKGGMLTICRNLVQKLIDQNKEVDVASLMQ